MCSQETPNVNNPNIEDKDSLLPKGFQKKKKKKNFSMIHASVQLSDSTNWFVFLSVSSKIDQKMQLFIESVFENYIKVIALWL